MLRRKEGQTVYEKVSSPSIHSHLKMYVLHAYVHIYTYMHLCVYSYTEKSKHFKEVVSIN